MREKNNTFQCNNLVIIAQSKNKIKIIEKNRIRMPSLPCKINVDVRKSWEITLEKVLSQSKLVCLIWSLIFCKMI